MKAIFSTLLVVFASAVPAFATVSVSSPVSGSTVPSPVKYVATGTTTCATGVASMGIYVTNKLVYTVKGNSLNTTLSLAAGKYGTVVEEWDRCGGASYTPVAITVGSQAPPTGTLVTVTSPANNSTVTSPVLYTASATTSCAKGVAAMGVYVSNKLLYTVNGSSLSTSIALAAGKYGTVVEEWDACGGASYTSLNITVQAGTTAAPTAGITANPTSITSGSSSTLTAAATNATALTITGTDGSTYTLQPGGGSQVVNPTSTTTYTATATGASGKASAAATITVSSAAATISIAASPASIKSGGSSTLTVVATKASSVTVSGTDGSTFTLPAAGGTQVVNPVATTTYTAQATSSGGGTVTNATTVTVTSLAPTVTMAASPASISSGSSSTLTVSATNATAVSISGSDGTTYTLQPSGGTQVVTPVATTTYSANATGSGGSTSATSVVTVTSGNSGSLQSIQHVVFMLQENHTFDNYFGMLNPYRKANGWNIGDDGKDYEVDGIDDKLSTTNNDDETTALQLFKLASTCVDDESSDWLASYGDVNPYNFLTSRPILMDGFVHNAEGYAKNCASTGKCSGNFTDLTGQRVMGYYDQDFLNYYYYMASQFAVSNRWFSPIASKSISNRIATFTGGTTQGLTKDPTNEDGQSQLIIPTIFQELDNAKVTWKIYYTVTQGLCLDGDSCTGTNAYYPATDFSALSYSYKYLYGKKAGVNCTGTTQPSSVVGDASNSFCIDPNHITPLSTYYTDLANGTLPSFAFIEAGYGNNDEHPGSGQSVLSGQLQVSKIVNAFMGSSSWKNSVFFFSYDEGGGPYEHVPPVPNHTNDFTAPSLGAIPDISSIAVNADSFPPCLPSGGAPTLHCDLSAVSPGANTGDAPAVNGFAAQLGFRLPNIVISPFTRRHYVSNIPMDHTAVIQFVESRFIGSSAHLTARDAAQPNLLDFFDFNSVPWATPPTPPAPVTPESLGYNPCQPTTMGP